VKRFLFTVLVASAASVATVAHAQDALEPVRSLYAAADFEAALAALDRLTPASNTQALDAARYRVFCLVALGRSTDADREIQGIVHREPMYVPSPEDASPRIRTTFNEVRRRVLPTVARSLYSEGKAAYDRKAMTEAVEKLERVLMILAIPDIQGQQELADLRTLASGFLDLSRAAAAASAAAPAAASPAAPTRAAATLEGEPAPSGPSGAAPSPAEGGELTEAVAIRQDLPPWSFPTPQLLGNELKGIVQVEIDDAGNVVGGRIIESVHALYDSVLLRAVRGWKYQPARRNGQPVKSFRHVAVIVRPR
jgi:hypothetical protein